MAPQPKKSFALRVDPALYAAVERLAGAELRSVNGQMEFLLREALQRRGALGPLSHDADAAQEAASDPDKGARQS